MSPDGVRYRVRTSESLFNPCFSKDSSQLIDYRSLKVLHVVVESHGNVADLLASLWRAFESVGSNFGVQFRVPEQDGSLKQVSLKTKISDVNGARRHAHNAEQMALKTAAADRTHGMEYGDILLPAIRDAGASRLTETKARKNLGRISEIARGMPVKSYTVRNRFAEYLR